MMRVLTTFLMLILLSFSVQGEPLPALKRERMIDRAGLLTRDQFRELNEQLVNYENRAADGSQFVVFIVNSTGQETVEQYAERVFNQWGVGRKGRDNGLLLLVAVQDRNLRFETGYGLEAIFPDVLAGRVIRERIIPAFKQDNYFTGIQAGVTDTINILSGNPPVYAEQRNTEQHNKSNKNSVLPVKFMPVIWLITFTCVFCWLLFFGTKKRKKEIQNEIDKVAAEADKIKSKHSHQKKTKREKANYIARLRGWQKQKYILPKFSSLYFYTSVYSLAAVFIIDILLHGMPDKVKAFVIVFIMMFICMIFSFISCAILRQFVPAFRQHDAMMEKISDSPHASPSFSSGSSSRGGSSSSSSGRSGGGGGRSGGGGASGSW